MEILRTERLSKTYGQGPAATQALRDVTFSVEQGSFSAIVGRSGSGKTTLLNLLGGLDTPTAGQVFYRGQSLYDLPRRQRDGFRRRRIGYVFQFFNLVPEFTAAENVCLPAYLDRRTPDLDLVAEILDKLELGDKAGRYPAEQVDSILMHEVVHWLRLMPYKLSRDRKRAAMFYAGLVMVANDAADHANR